jgi:hypothetical protein
MLFNMFSSMSALRQRDCQSQTLENTCVSLRTLDKVAPLRRQVVPKHAVEGCGSRRSILIFNMITEFARHLLERYGTEELAQWYFEVWTELNIDSWGRFPRQRRYFELHDHTARALKSVSSRLEFLKHTSENLSSA